MKEYVSLPLLLFDALLNVEHATADQLQMPSHLLEKEEDSSIDRSFGIGIDTTFDSYSGIYRICVEVNFESDVVNLLSIFLKWLRFCILHRA